VFIPSFPPLSLTTDPPHPQNFILPFRFANLVPSSRGDNDAGTDPQSVDEIGTIALVYRRVENVVAGRTCPVLQQRETTLSEAEKRIGVTMKTECVLLSPVSLFR
jgi:hypothetical protein